VGPAGVCPQACYMCRPLPDHCCTATPLFPTPHVHTSPPAQHTSMAGSVLGSYSAALSSTSRLACSSSTAVAGASARGVSKTRSIGENSSWGHHPWMPAHATGGHTHMCPKACTQGVRGIMVTSTCLRMCWKLSRQLAGSLCARPVSTAGAHNHCIARCGIDTLGCCPVLVQNQVAPSLCATPAASVPCM
jgi:hypothetical protein